MKKTLVLVLILAAIAGVFYVTNREVVAPTVEPVASATEEENVESYLRANISRLSPVPPVLGGTWYVVSVIVSPGTKTGTVEYEDGHIAEKRNFSYTTAGAGEVTSLTIN